MIQESLLSKNMSNLMNIYSTATAPNNFHESAALLLFQPKSSLFKGEFYFADFASERRELWMVLSLDPANHIYSVGRDSVGPFVCVGRKFSENSANFAQKYFDDYEINFECFYFSNDSIEGNWRTTNAKGHFVLRRDTSYDLGNSIAASLEDIMILLRNPADDMELLRKLRTFDEHMLQDVEVFRPFLSNSVLAVVLHGAQGGIPSRKIEREFEDLEQLFEQYKNVNLLSDVSDNESVQEEEEWDPLKGSGSETSESVVISQRRNVRSNSIISEGNIFAKFRSIDSNTSRALNGLRKIISTQSRQSFGILNQETISKLTDIIKDHSKINNLASSGLPIENSISRLRGAELTPEPSKQETPKSEFLMRLEGIISNLKEVRVKPKKIAQGDLYSLFGGKCFSWKGELETLGKSEEFIVENMFIIRDHIEGVFCDSENYNYEMAGSFSHRTLQFEIVGISIKKDKSFKFRGHMTPSFQLVGQIMFRPFSRAASNLNLVLIGVRCHVNWLSKVDESQTKLALPILYKRTDNLIYLMVHVDGRFVFGNGILNEETGLYSIELTWKEKRFMSEVLEQKTHDLEGNPTKGITFESETSVFEIISKKCE